MMDWGQLLMLLGAIALILLLVVIVEVAKEDS